MVRELGRLGRVLDILLVLLVLAVAVNVIDSRERAVREQAPLWNCVPILPLPMVPRA